MRFGYAYVRAERDVDMVRVELVARGVGVDDVTVDVSAHPRPVHLVGLSTLLGKVTADDELVVSEVGRLAVSGPHLRSVVDELAARGAVLELGGERIDPASERGRGWVSGIHTAVTLDSALERDRRRVGMQAASDNDRLRGRRPRMTDEQHAQAYEWHTVDARPVDELADYFGVSRASMYRALARERRWRTDS